jgi:hypothetical protein
VIATVVEQQMTTFAVSFHLRDPLLEGPNRCFFGRLVLSTPFLAKSFEVTISSPHLVSHQDAGPIRSFPQEVGAQLLALVT